MKKLFILTIITVISFQLSYAQSLADIAKKEKERREQLKQQGKTSRVVTEEDLKNASDKRTGIEIPEEKTSEEPEQEISSSTTLPSEEYATTEEYQETETTSQSESTLSEQIDTQIAQLTKRLEELKQKRNEEEDRINRGAGIFTFNPGEAYQKIREMDQQIKDLELQIQTLKAQETGV